MLKIFLSAIFISTLIAAVPSTQISVTSPKDVTNIFNLVYPQNNIQVSPEKYGAYGNGSSVDSTFFQAMFNANPNIVVNLLSNKIYILENVQLLTGSNVRITGFGTLKHKANSVNGIANDNKYMIYGSPRSFILDGGVVLDGNKANQGGSAYLGTLSINSPSLLRVRDCFFTNSIFDALYIANITGSAEISGCNFQEMSLHGNLLGQNTYGIRINSTSSATNLTTIANNYFEGPATITSTIKLPVAIAWNPNGFTNKVLTIQNNIIKRCGCYWVGNFGGAIELYQYASLCTVTGNKIYNNYSWGINLADGNDIDILDNDIAGEGDGSLSGLSGINVAHRNNWTLARINVRGNRLFNLPNSKGISMTGVATVGTVQDCSIENNYMYNVKRGIDIVQATNNLSVLNNKIFHVVGADADDIGIRIYQCFGNIDLGHNIVYDTVQNGIYYDSGGTKSAKAQVYVHDNYLNLIQHANAIYTRNAGSIVYKNNQVYGTTTPYFIDLTTNTVMHGNLADPSLTYTPGGDVIDVKDNSWLDTTAKYLVDGKLKFTDHRFKIIMKQAGTGADTSGTVVLVAGTATVNTTAVNNKSMIFLTSQTAGLSGVLRIAGITPDTSFIIESSNAGDTPTIAWMLVDYYP